MKVNDLRLDEYVDAFGKMTEQHFIEYLRSKDMPADWVDKMRWTKYNAQYKELVDKGVITGREADSKYWIRLFRQDVENVGKFIELIKNSI